MFSALRRAAVLLTALTIASTATSAHASVVGPDVASYQHPNGYTIGWSRAQASGGAKFAFIKATEGTGYTNPYYARDYATLAALHMVRGAYHFARPSIGSAIAQARHFMAATGPLRAHGDLPPVLDLELNGGLTPSQLITWTRQFLTETARLSGRTPILYTYPSFWTSSMANTAAFTGYPLWIAGYSSHPSLVGGWSHYTFWQYTDRAALPGMAGPVDMSVFNGTLPQLWAMADGPYTAVSAPAPAGPAPHVTTPIPARPVRATRSSSPLSRYRFTLLRPGSRGPAVTALQRALRLTADGDYGPMTFAAVEAFQKSHHLVVDGAVGPQTWAALGA